MLLSAQAMIQDRVVLHRDQLRPCAMFQARMAKLFHVKLSVRKQAVISPQQVTLTSSDRRRIPPRHPVYASLHVRGPVSTSVERRWAGVERENL